MKSVESLLKSYENKKSEIKKTLQEFKNVINESDEKIFSNLAYCLCTPQSKATICLNAINSLEKNNLLYIGSEEQIKPFLNAVRFNQNKTRYIIEARKIFYTNDGFNIKKILQSMSPSELRDWLSENIMGIGMKEASHFLRNIGLGSDFAILDVHVLKNLHKHGVIDEIPKSLTKKKYLEIEEKMKKFSQQISIPFDELDLLFWSEETGHIFK